MSHVHERSRLATSAYTGRQPASVHCSPRPIIWPAIDIASSTIVNATARRKIRAGTQQITAAELIGKRSTRDILSVSSVFSFLRGFVPRCYIVMPLVKGPLRANGPLTLRTQKTHSNSWLRQSLKCLAFY